MRRKHIIIGLSGICLLGLGAGLMVPRLLVQEATQAPSTSEAGTFVTRPADAPIDLNQKLQESLLAAGVPVKTAPPAEPPENPSENENPGEDPGTDTRAPAPPADEVIWRSPPRQQPAGDSPPAAPEAAGQPDSVTPTEAPASRPPQARRTAAPPAASQRQPEQAATEPQAFEVSMSENDISSLVYGQLQRGIDPRYRQALQGVSTRIQQGKARVTVALLPKHLPPAFLKNLPGVTPSTPTVYLGGEMSLHQQGSRVVADIHHISLGNFKVPMPFIQSAVRSQVEAYSQQMLRLPDGRQAELYSVALDQGALTLTGMVN